MLAVVGATVEATGETTAGLPRTTTIPPLEQKEHIEHTLEIPWEKLSIPGS